MGKSFPLKVSLLPYIVTSKLPFHSSTKNHIRVIMKIRYHMNNRIDRNPHCKIWGLNGFKFSAIWTTNMREFLWEVICPKRRIDCLRFAHASRFHKRSLVFHISTKLLIISIRFGLETQCLVSDSRSLSKIWLGVRA